MASHVMTMVVNKQIPAQVLFTSDFDHLRAEIDSTLKFDYHLPCDFNMIDIIKSSKYKVFSEGESIHFIFYLPLVRSADTYKLWRVFKVPVPFANVQIILKETMAAVAVNTDRMNFVPMSENYLYQREQSPIRMCPWYPTVSSYKGNEFIAGLITGSSNVIEHCKMKPLAQSLTSRVYTLPIGNNTWLVSFANPGLVAVRRCFSEECLTTDSPILAIIPAAMGDTLLTNVMLTERQMCVWEARIILAQLLTNAQLAGRANIAAGDVNALLWFHLTAIWAAPACADVEARNIQRNRLQIMIQSSPPQPNALQGALHKFLVLVGQAAISTPTTTAQMREYWIDFTELENPSGQYLTIAQQFAHALNWELILELTPAQATAINTMRRANYPNPPIVNFGEVTLNAQFAASWVNFTLRDNLIILGIMANQSRPDIQAALVGAIAGSIIVICKERYPVLWNLKDKDYFNTKLKEDVFKRLMCELDENQLMGGMDVKQLKAKIKSIKDVYRQEVNKIERSRKSGAGTDELYSPKLAWFKRSMRGPPNAICQQLQESGNENLKETADIFRFEGKMRALAEVVATRGKLTLSYRTRFTSDETHVMDFTKKKLTKKNIVKRPNSIPNLRGISTNRKSQITQNLLELMPENRRPFWVNLVENDKSADLRTTVDD
ncbi:hypothetical protein GE061_018593 [Apolygus lucorum]|uniref:MADF domain-containing protein n=1 Tax=Apolygus lucorum TaxID=248454 RepID=A0A8S9XEB8_APOLU|nr:hypothetical protein GE061_018593 [Apolygus lucorum]